MEQRSATRSRTLLPALISFDRGRSTTEAVVRDLSEAGARLKVSAGVPLPELFEIHFQRTDERRHARLCWRRGDFVGVQFEGAPAQEADDEPVGASSAAAQRIRELEAEVAKLRRLLDELRADPGRMMHLLDQAAV